jgi:hypothetical protein
MLPAAYSLSRVLPARDVLVHSSNCLAAALPAALSRGPRPCQCSRRAQRARLKGRERSPGWGRTGPPPGEKGEGAAGPEKTLVASMPSRRRAENMRAPRYGRSPAPPPLARLPSTKKMKTDRQPRVERAGPHRPLNYDGRPTAPPVLLGRRAFLPASSGCHVQGGPGPWNRPDGDRWNMRRTRLPAGPESSEHARWALPQATH